MEDGEEFHIFNEEPLRFTEEGLKILIDSGMYTIGYDPYDITDLMMIGMEIFHASDKGLITRVPVLSDKGQELVNNTWEPFEPSDKMRWMSKKEVFETYGHLLSKEELEHLKIDEKGV